MKTHRLMWILVFSGSLAMAGDLDSWNSGTTKQAILNYVGKVTQSGTSDFIPEESRIAVFDNDGTLWGEKPFPVQLQFTLERVRQLAPKHPEWKTQQPFKAVLENDKQYLSQAKEQDVLKLLAATHAGMTQAQFMKIAKDWFKTSKDSKIYRPMTELLAYLRAHGFKTYVVTGGGREFVRAFAESRYGIPPEQVIGSSVQMKFKYVDGKPALEREAKIAQPLNINEGKPINIEREIGRVPVVAVGNSDVDLQMLQYTASSPFPSLKILIQHDDAKREYAYTKGAEKVLAEAEKRHWAIASIKSDFKTLYETGE